MYIEDHKFIPICKTLNIFMNAALTAYFSLTADKLWRASNTVLCRHIYT